MERATVVVVGAGLSGLTSAREMHRAGVDVLVLEAADRVGGRAMSETSALGSRLDLGGQWIGHDHRHLTALVTELGLSAYPMHTARAPLIIDGPRRVSLASPTVLIAAAALVVAGMLGVTGVPKRLTGVTVDRWLRRVPGPTARRLLEVIAQISWTCDLDRTSVYSMVEMIRSQHGLTTMLSTRGGAQESLVVEGAGTLAERIATELGDRVRTGQRVTALLRDDDGVTVRTGAGEIRAAKVVVTMPPPTAARITHEPPLPAVRAALQRNTYMGSVYKAVAVYERPFWRTGRGAEMLVLDGPGSAVFDSTAPGGPGHLTVLIGGPAARDLDELDAETRRTTVLGPLVPHLGADVLEPASWHEKSWHRDEFAGGGYTALARAGTTDGLAPMPSTPIGGIHWAGAETASEHPGYLDGAIEAGRRAAGEVIAALSRRPTP